MRFFYSTLVVLCLVAYLFFLYESRWKPLIAFKELLGNFAIGIVGSILSLIVIRSQLEKVFDSLNLKNSGIKGYKNGYPEILESLGGAETFFTLRMNKKIDVFGIAMSGFFEENSIVDLLYRRAKKGYQVRVFFADPESEELKNQEQTENKPGELQLNIKRLTRELSDKFSAEKGTRNKIKIYHLRSLPRAFILRSGNRMIVTNYLYEGPTQAPSIYLKDDDYLNAFEKYLDYIEASTAEDNSKEIAI